MSEEPTPQQPAAPGLMTRSRVIVAAVAAVLVLVVVAAVVVTMTSSGPDVESAADVAELAGCTNYEDDEAALFVTDSGRCVIGQDELRVHYFGSNSARNNWIEFAGEFGAQALLGDHYAISADPEVLAALQEDLGGDIEP